MNPQSPPKRMTRARAAAKTGDDTASSAAATRAKSSTAASKAKAARSTATATTASVAAKRKIRPDEAETDNEQDELGSARLPHMIKPARGVRGRPKKTAAEADARAATAAAAAEAAAQATRAPRGRPAKKTATAAPKEQQKQPTTRAAASSTTRAARTKKTAQTDADADDEAATTTSKKTARTRAKATSTAASSSAVPTIAVRTAAAIVAAKAAAPKKRVTFEEPEKENIAPKMTAKATKSAAAAKAAETASGLRAQPTRRAATAAAAPKSAMAARSTRAVASARGASAGAVDAEKTVDKPPAPLSPKKVTQVRMARDDVESEDELGAMDGNPVYIKPLLRSPSKPGLPMGAQDRAKTLAGAGLDLESASRDVDSSQPTDGLLSASELPGAILASPARRPPPSPAKDGLMRSPARRIDGMAPPPDNTVSVFNPTVSKASLLLSPAKRFPIPIKSSGSSLEDTTRSPFKPSLLQSPAKRPASPIKAAIFLHRPDMKPTAAEDELEDDTETTPEPHSIIWTASQPATPSVEGTPTQENEDDSDSLTQMLSEMASDAAAMQSDSPTRLRFSERLSAAASRDTHPAVAVESPPAEAPEQDGRLDGNPAVGEEAVAPEDPMEIDEAVVDAAPTMAAMSLPKPKLAAPIGGAFGLRARDLAPLDVESDSEDELTNRIPVFSFSAEAVPATPCPPGKRRTTRTPSSRRDRERSDGQSPAKRLRTSKLGFTPLAEQLNNWQAHSPLTMTEVLGEIQNEQDAMDSPCNAESAVPSALVEEAVPDHTANSPADQDSDMPVDDGMLSMVPEVLPPIFDKVSLMQEDLELASEANDMSLMEAEQLGELLHPTPSPDDSASEDSQEYGDENAIPIDPALMAQSAAASSPAVPPVTPQRVMMHTFHTVSKVPLKAADESTPQPVMRRRSFSVSRQSASRNRPAVGIVADSNGGDNSGDSSNSTCGLTRSATVLSCSPTKKGRRHDSRRQSRRESFAGEAAVAEMLSDEEREIVRSLTNSPAPATPARSEGGWSVAATPARTPRRDIDPALLRGAVVFVDVYTTEGADASGIFVELLTQMGARCVKSWPWNPSSPPGDNNGAAAGSTAKIGITHVVFKDGGKRTLEKVRESAGVVQCVGVSWVLDCERENQWLDEAPYYVDTSSMPRGGVRRRKSMEPRALANMNGMIVTTPAKQTNVASQYRDCRTAPSTPANRQQTVMWADSPDDCGTGTHQQDDSVDGYEDDDAAAEGPAGWMLTAVPKTPAPEAIARYAAALSPSTAMDDEDEDEDTIMSMQHEQSMLMTRTCPPKNVYRELGENILSREKDAGVLMRLMSARRKSLQFAPKVASPLSKAWY